MIDCLLIGDSIAVGTHTFRKDCVMYAQGGINSKNWNKKFKDKDLSAKTVIISLGSNDLSYPQTAWELENLRKKTKADKVYWILPAIKPNIRKIVREVAEKYNDSIIEIDSLQKDGVHPSWHGYENIAKKTRNK